MRWNCEKQGCFNVKKRPKIELLNEALPGKIKFGDVDGIVEINGKTLMVEFKPDRMQLQTGQRLMYERITADGKNTVIVVAGDAETMDVKAHFVYFEGRRYPGGLEWTDSNLELVKDVIRRWVESVQRKAVA